MPLLDTTSGNILCPVCDRAWIPPGWSMCCGCSDAKHRADDEARKPETVIKALRQRIAELERLIDNFVDDNGNLAHQWTVDAWKKRDTIAPLFADAAERGKP